MKLLIVAFNVIAMAGGVVVFYQISRLNRIFPSVIAGLLSAAICLLFISRIISLLVLAYPWTLVYMHLLSAIIFCGVIACVASAIKILADGWRELTD